MNHFSYQKKVQVPSNSLFEWEFEWVSKCFLGICLKLAKKNLFSMTSLLDHSDAHHSENNSDKNIRRANIF